MNTRKTISRLSLIAAHFEFTSQMTVKDSLLNDYYVFYF